MSNYAQVEKRYNAAEFESYVETARKISGNDDARYELIDGVVYMMASPNETHHDLSDFLHDTLRGYFSDKGCKVYRAPFDLYLFDKRKYVLFTMSKADCDNQYIPDFMVVCDKNKRKPDGVYGAPDIVIEIVSKSNATNDYVRKLNPYITFGVKEYWILDPGKKKIIVYDNTSDDVSLYNYTFDDIVKSMVFDDLAIDFKMFVFPDEG